MSEQLGRGYIQRDFMADPVGGGPFSRKYDRPLFASDEERFDEIRRRDNAHEWWDELARDAGMKPKHQSRTNSCWVQCVTMGYEFHEIRQGGVYVPKSPGSVAGLINQGRDVGGWCSQALNGIIEYGICDEADWPPNEFSPRRNTAEVRAARQKSTITEYDDLTPKNSRVLIDYVIKHGPAAVAHMRWQHATLLMRIGISQSRGKRSFVLTVWNSGYGRDDKGITVLDESWAVADEAVAMRVVTA